MPFKRVQKFSKPTQQIGVAVLVPHTRFTPTPNMSPERIAFEKGAEAKRLNRPITDNPGGEHAAHWERGYNAN